MTVTSAQSTLQSPRNRNRLMLVSFSILAITQILAVISSMIRNSQYLLGIDPNYPSFDTAFFLRSLLVIVGIYTTIRLLQYYKTSHNPDYLLVGFFVFVQSVGLLLWFSWQANLSPLQEYFLVSDPLTDQRWTQNLPELILATFPYFLSNVVIAIFAIRSRPWHEYHIVEKSVLVILILELSLITFRNGLLISLFRTIDPSTYFEHFAPTQWYSQLTIFGLLFSGGQWVSAIIAPSIVLYVFITMKLTVSNDETKNAKFGWIAFGFVAFVLSVLDLLPILVSSLEFIYNYPIFAYASAGYIIILQVLMILYPEAVVLTDYQILKAKRLYDEFETSSEDGPPERKASFLDYQSRLKEYISKSYELTGMD